MKAYAQPIKQLISELGKLPGIGEKTAARLANYILRSTEDDVKKLAESIIEVKRKIKLCRICLNLTEEDICYICHDTTRDKDVICVVEDPDALAAIEESAGDFGELIIFFTVLWRPWTESGQKICGWASFSRESTGQC